MPVAGVLIPINATPAVSRGAAQSPAPATGRAGAGFSVPHCGKSAGQWL